MVLLPVPDRGLGAGGGGGDCEPETGGSAIITRLVEPDLDLRPLVPSLSVVTRFEAGTVK